MKKYLFSLFAVVLGIGFTAFTGVSKNTFSFDEFVYVGADFSESEVTDVTNWVISGTPQNVANCGTTFTPEVACRLQINKDLHSYIQDGHLESGVEIIVTGAADTKMVTDVEDPSDNSILDGKDEAEKDL